MTQYHRPTDAEKAAQWAAEALNEGRYELGVALARIAQQAGRVEQRPAPARDVLDANVYRMPTPAAGPDPEELPIARTAFMPRIISDPPANPVPVIPAHRRCAAMIVRDGADEVCRQAIYWQESSDAWRHLDPLVDRHHPASGVDETVNGL